MVSDMRRRPLVPLLLAALVAAGAGAGCSVEEPRLAVTGPSEYALSIALAAAPDQLPRDGASQSVITVTVRNESGRPVPGQPLSITSNVGRVSQSEIVTGDDGRATFAFVAPTSSASAGLNNAVLQVTPIGSTSRTAFSRTLTIPLVSSAGVTSATVPTASFTSSPSAPSLRETVTFDASASTDEGVRCLDQCTYAWDFGGEATTSGRIATYQFRSARVYAVTLTVTDSAGAAGTTTQNVTVSEGTAPTATIGFSPSSPAIFEAVNFTAEASRPGQAGRTIISHVWQFGDGTNASGLRASKTYAVTGTYTVTLTVTDSAGLQGTTTQAVTVVTGVTASFTTSNPTDGSLIVYFNAEESRGSSTGFGTRNPITKYIWHFGDGTSVEETSSPRISHTFAVAATYRVTLTVEDNAGRRQVTSAEVAVAN